MFKSGYLLIIVSFNIYLLFPISPILALTVSRLDVSRLDWPCHLNQKPPKKDPTIPSVDVSTYLMGECSPGLPALFYCNIAHFFACQKGPRDFQDLSQAERGDGEGGRSRQTLRP